MTANRKKYMSWVKLAYPDAYVRQWINRKGWVIHLDILTLLGYKENEIVVPAKSITDAWKQAAERIQDIRRIGLKD